MKSSLFNPLRFNLPVSTLMSTTMPNLTFNPAQVTKPKTWFEPESDSTLEVADQAGEQAQGLVSAAGAPERNDEGTATGPATVGRVPSARPTAKPFQKPAARLASVLPPVSRAPRHSPLIVAERTRDARFRFVVRSTLNVVLLTSGAFDSEAQLQSAIEAFNARCGDESAYRIEADAQGFVISLAAEEGTELARTGPVVRQDLAKATVRLIAQQASHARVVALAA